MSASCAWCGQAFEPRRDGGKMQRFCSTAHRRAFDHAARAWVRWTIEAGLLSMVDLRKASGTTRALVPGAPAASPGSDGVATRRSPAEACAPSQRTGRQAGASIQSDGGAAKSARKYRARSGGAAGRSQAPRPVLSAAAQRQFIRSYLATGRWGRDWGPPPGNPDCWVDSDILDEYADVLEEMTSGAP